MTYLYGDSSDSGLELNYIELLRDFLDFAVQIMLSEQRIDESIQQAEDQKSKANSELENLRALGDAVGRALEQSKSGGQNSITNKSVAALRQVTQDTLRKAAESLKAQVAAGNQEIQVRKQRERSGNAKITERLLLHHDLPDSINTVAISINAEGNAYDARVDGSCKQGLRWVFAAEIPAKNQFHEVLKVSTLAPELSIELPEMSGFVRKSVKLKTYRVSTFFITGLANEGQDLVLTLRSVLGSPDPTGLDIRITRAARRVTVKRLDKGEEAAPFQVSDEDAAALMKICDELEEDRLGLVEYRAKLLKLVFDGKELSECPDPKILLRRLIDRIGPVIRDIAKHSLAESELVLKRVLANDRREEIFASRADLLSKLNGVAIGMRGIFAPLGLGDLGTGKGDDSPTNLIEDPPTKKQSSISELSSSPPPRPHMNRSDSAPTLADLEDEATNIANAPPALPAVHVMEAMAQDEEQTDAGVGPASPNTISKIRLKKQRQVSGGPPRPPPEPALPPPGDDSIDIALAELDAET
jgi:hypothetical protein